MAILAFAAAAFVSAAATAYTTYTQYQNQAKEAKYNQQVEDINAQTARQAAEADAAVKRQQYERLIGRQRALYGGSGAEVDVGSPLLLTIDTARQGEWDAQRRIWQGEASATSSENAAGFYGWQSHRAKSAALPMSFINGISAGVGTYFGLGGKMPKLPSGGQTDNPGAIPGVMENNAGMRIPRYSAGQP